MTDAAQVHVTWLVTGDLDEDRVFAEMWCLSAEERRRGAHFVHAADRRDFAAAHILLRQSLSAVEPRDPATWTFVRNRTGKPELANHAQRERALAFNLSHTRGLVACVVARGAEVGIDVERVSGAADIVDLARHHFSPGELADIERCEPRARAARCIELWTLKEACAKATGAGIASGLGASEFTFGPSSVSARTAEPGGQGAWHLALFGLLDYRLAVAVRTEAGHAAALTIDGRGGALGANRHAPEIRVIRASTPGLVVSGV